MKPSNTQRDFALIEREMARCATLAKIDYTSKRFKSLRDNYTKAKVRQYQQMHIMKKTKHK